MINVKDFFKKRNYYFFVKVKIFLLAFINNKITIRKIYNLFICNISYLLRSSKSGKAPVIVSVDLWNECNENCVFCRDASGNSNLGGSTKSWPEWSSAKPSIQLTELAIDKTWKKQAN